MISFFSPDTRVGERQNWQLMGESARVWAVKTLGQKLRITEIIVKLAYQLALYDPNERGPKLFARIHNS